MLEEIEPTEFKTFTNPKPQELGGSVEHWLRALAGPAHIHLHGRLRSRSRVVVTLLHGNEPSGVGAVFQMLKQQLLPAVDVHIFLPNVAAALVPPGFAHRMLPGRRDLNRCFKPPYVDAQGVIAKNLLDKIAGLSPEAAIDIHNTSGEGPAFAVTTHMDRRHDALSSLFTHRVVVTDLRLGALMEISERICPTITVECGGARSEAALQTAKLGLMKFMQSEDVLTPQAPAPDLDFYHNPIRLELVDKAATPLNFSTIPAVEGLTLLPDIEKYNFNVVTPEQPLGYVGASGVSLLTARDAQGAEQVDSYFEAKDGWLYATRILKLFMITSNASIARSDCLFYFVQVG